MNKNIEIVYLREIERQCGQGLSAYRQIMHAFQFQSGVQQIMGSLDDLIDHASRVTLLLWPVKGQNKGEEKRLANERRMERGAYLRNILDIADNNYLKSKTLRDHLHHFDERLDEWAHVDGRMFIDSNVGPKNNMFQIGGAPPVGLRHYDPATKIYSFRDEDYSVQAVHDSLLDVQKKSESRIAEIQDLRWKRN